MSDSPFKTDAYVPKTQVGRAAVVPEEVLLLRELSKRIDAIERMVAYLIVPGGNWDPLGTPGAFKQSGSVCQPETHKLVAIDVRTALLGAAHPLTKQLVDLRESEIKTAAAADAERAELREREAQEA